MNSPMKSVYLDEIKDESSIKKFISSLVNISSLIGAKFVLLNT